MNYSSFDCYRDDFTFRYFRSIHRSQLSRNQGETAPNATTQAEDPILSRLNHRFNRCHHNRLLRMEPWPQNSNSTTFDLAAAAAAVAASASASTSTNQNPNSMFVPQDTRPAANVEPPPPLSPDVLMFEPYTNVQSPPNAAESGSHNAAPESGATPFAATNNSAIGPQTARHQPSSRCPYYRRLSMSGYHNMPNHYHPTLQNGNAYLRPAYAPHESLWYRQQNNQEIHRRHMMNSMSGTNVSNDSTTSNTFGTYPGRGATNMTNNGFCLQCDQQHPIGHPHRRIRQYVCGLNLVSNGFDFEYEFILVTIYD